MAKRLAYGIGLVGAAAIAVILALPSLHRTVDDAWISFRYAENLANGDGLVWSDSGPPVEGYSNLTWTLLVALGRALGAPLLPWVWGLALALAAGTVAAAAACVRAAGGSRAAAVGAALLVATSAVMRPWLLTGLETPLMAFLVTVATWRLLAERAGPAAGAALLWGLVAVTRPEGALYLAVPAAVWVWRGLRRGSDAAEAGARPDARRALLAAGLLVGPLLAQIGFRLATYGALVANTGTAKLAWGTDPERVGAWRYLGAALTYDPLLTAVLALGGALAVAHRRAVALLPLLPAAAFVLVANGDNFSELRLLAPVVPCAAAGALVGLDAWARGRARAVHLAGAVLLVVAAAVAEARVVRIDRIAAPAGPPGTVSLVRRLAPPYVTVPDDAAALYRSQLLRWPVAPRIELGWFVRTLIERLPHGETFVFEDIGLVGWLVLDGRLLDARGLTWPEAARVVTKRLPAGPALAEVPEVRAFREAFHREDPALVFLTCPVEGFQSAVERILLTDPAFTARWTLAARGPYFADQGRLCLYERAGFSPAEPAVGIARYRRLEAEVPDLFDWTGLREALETDPRDPARRWRVAPDGTPLPSAAAAAEEDRPRPRGAPRGPRRRDAEPANETPAADAVTPEEAREHARRRHVRGRAE